MNFACNQISHQMAHHKHPYLLSRPGLINKSYIFNNHGDYLRFILEYVQRSKYSIIIILIKRKGGHIKQARHLQTKSNRYNIIFQGVLARAKAF